MLENLVREARKKVELLLKPKVANSHKIKWE